MTPWVCEQCTFQNFDVPPGGDCEMCGLPWSVQVALQPALAAAVAAPPQRQSRQEERGQGGDRACRGGRASAPRGCTQCPLPACGLELPTAALADEHFELHRIAGDDIDEALELARLRRRYGFDADPANASYEQQYALRLEAQVSRGKLTTSQAAGKTAQMEADLADCEERGAVSGLMPHVCAALDRIHQPPRRRATGRRSGQGSATSEDPETDLAAFPQVDAGTAASSTTSSNDGTMCVDTAAAVPAEPASLRGAAWVACGAGVVHSHGGFGDSGWGCGYRNIQMLSSYLLSCGSPHEAEYRSVLFGGTGHLPPVPRLQEWLDRAWQAGFDPEGAEQLEGSVAHSKKLIGATECATLLRSFGVRAFVCSFASPAVPAEELERRRLQAAAAASADNAAHPERKKLKQPQHVPAFEPCVELLQFCWDYFARRQPTRAVCEAAPFCPPLYLQHEGHSRTVVAAERDRCTGSISLLLFDPAQESAAIQADVRDRRRLQRLRRAGQTFTQPKYQVCVIAPGIADEEEREHLKTIAELPARQALELQLS